MIRLLSFTEKKDILATLKITDVMGMAYGKGLVLLLLIFILKFADILTIIIQTPIKKFVKIQTRSTG